MSTVNNNNERLEQLMRQVHDLPPVAHEDAVLRIPQEMTDTQKWQARANIGAVSEDEVKTLIGNAGGGGTGGGGNVEEIVMDMLVAMEIAPVLLNSDGTVLADDNGALLNL